MLSACTVPQNNIMEQASNSRRRSRSADRKVKPTKEWKLCLVGDPGVGKTSIGVRFQNNRFVETQKSTVGAAFFSVDITIGNEVHRLNTWDTAGQERYRALAPLYFRNTEAVVIVYSINHYETFQNIMNIWLPLARSHTDSNVLLTIVGNKLDTSENREVQTEEAQTFARDIDAIFIETSAKTGENIEKLFESIAQKLRLLSKTRPRRNYSTASSISTDSEHDPENHQSSSSGCCR